MSFAPALRDGMGAPVHGNPGFHPALFSNPPSGMEGTAEVEFRAGPPGRDVRGCTITQGFTLGYSRTLPPGGEGPAAEEFGPGLPGRGAHACLR